MILLYINQNLLCLLSIRGEIYVKGEICFIIYGFIGFMHWEVPGPDRKYKFGTLLS